MLTFYNKLVSINRDKFGKVIINASINLHRDLYLETKKFSIGFYN